MNEQQFKPDIISALTSLRPHGSFTLYDPEDLSTLEWDQDTDPPSEDEIEAEFERLTTEFENREYARKRAGHYPPIGDQLDALYHAGVFPPEMKSMIQKVKEQFPKE